jgi:signal transduction histidine kinase
MTDYSLFNHEKSVLKRGAEISQDNSYQSSALLHEYKLLLGNYKKLYKQTKLLTSLNDKQQSSLTNSNNELDRKNKAIFHAQSEAEQSSRSKSLFLASMSHELRTPMNAILGYSEMLLEDAEADGNVGQSEDLKKIILSGKHLLSLISDILDLSKIEAGKIDLLYEPTDLKNIISEIEHTVQPLLNQNTNQLKIDIPDKLENIKTDITRMKQVILNLLSNACKFTHNGQINLSIYIKKQEQIEWIYITVEDTGIGMSEKQLESLFDEFSQASASITRDYGGTGLGLSISKKLAIMMGGDLVVSSVLNKGSTFTLQLPKSPLTTID